MKMGVLKLFFMIGFLARGEGVGDLSPGTGSHPGPWQTRREAFVREGLERLASEVQYSEEELTVLGVIRERLAEGKLPLVIQAKDFGYNKLRGWRCSILKGVEIWYAPSLEAVLNNQGYISAKGQDPDERNWWKETLSAQVLQGAMWRREKRAMEPFDLRQAPPNPTSPAWKARVFGRLSEAEQNARARWVLLRKEQDILRTMTDREYLMTRIVPFYKQELCGTGHEKPQVEDIGIRFEGEGKESVEVILDPRESRPKTLARLDQALADLSSTAPVKIMARRTHATYPTFKEVIQDPLVLTFARDLVGALADEDFCVAVTRALWGMEGR